MSAKTALTLEKGESLTKASESSSAKGLFEAATVFAVFAATEEAEAEQDQVITLRLLESADLCPPPHRKKQLLNVCLPLSAQHAHELELDIN
eukprot:3939490-Rhodomonas_salina.1